MTEFDYLITGGEVIDGTGNPSFHATIGVSEGRMTVLRGETSELARKHTIDASGHVVAPGFIDSHSHSDIRLFEDPLLESKVRQGVTTEVIGVDGLSYAPFADPDDRRAFVLQNAGIAGLNDNLPAWSTIGEQLAAYDGSTAVNVATLVGNTAVRVCAVGWEDVTPSVEQRGHMRALVREAMDEGALGLSTGLDYPPGGYAQTDELIELARVAAASGGIYHTHVRYALGDRFLDPFREATKIGEHAGLPVQLTHFSKSGRDSRPEGAQRMLDFVEDERDRGVDVTFDTYPYEWGGTRLARLLPAWVQAGHPDRLAERLADPRNRKRLVEDILTSPAVQAYQTSRAFSDVRLTNLTDPADAENEFRYLSEVVRDRGGDLADTLISLVQANPAAGFTRPAPHAMTLWKFVTHPFGMIASDSVFVGRAPSPRAYGTFARVLSDFVREEKLLTLPEAIRKMTSFPARTLGLSGRGVIATGAHADLVIFDPKTVGPTATYEHPQEFAQGVRDVLVSGVPVLENGRMTGRTPGRGVRRQDT